MKKIFYALIAVAAIILIAGGLIYSAYFASGPLATLIVDSGTAQYKIADEWQNARSGMSLKEGYSVKTLEDSAASILLLNSIFRMDANTEISLSELTPESISISQIIGRTWTKLMKISGIDNFEVSTPDAIATVRGTAFSTEVGNDTRIAVVNGSVNVQVNGTGAEGSVNANQEATINSGDEEINPIDLLIDEWITNNIQLDEEHKEAIKARIKEKYSTLIDTAKKQQDISDEDADELLNDWVDGKYSIKEEIEKGTIPSSLARLIPSEFKRY
jgi:hypothetical protein